MWDSSNFIHETAMVHPHAELGERNYVGQYATVGATVKMGDDNWVGPSVVLGSPSQHRAHQDQLIDWKRDASAPIDVVIGSRNVLREFVTVQRPTIDECTSIGNDNYFMTQSHIPHDAVIGNHVTLANSVHIGGHTRVMSHSTIGLGTVVHQRSVVGPFVMVGMGAVFKGVGYPIAMYIGNPARLLGVNRVERFQEILPEADFDRISSTLSEVQTEQDLWSAVCTLVVEEPACFGSMLEELKEFVELLKAR